MITQLHACYCGCSRQKMAQTASSRRCSDSVSKVRVEQTKSGRGSNVARDPKRNFA